MRWLMVVVVSTGVWAQPNAKKAEEAYKNIEIFKGMPAERVPMIMGMFNRVLGVQCTHCHVDGAMENGEKPTFAKTRVMFKMRNWIAQTQKVNVSCWSCHRGNASELVEDPAIFRHAAACRSASAGEDLTTLPEKPPPLCNRWRRIAQRCRRGAMAAVPHPPARRRRL